VDFAVSTSLKWMCGTPGAGVLYLSPRLVPHMHPELRGWFSQPDPFNWDIGRFSYAPDIRRFDSGTPGVMAALASLPALDWHAGQDRAAMVAHNRHLTGQLIGAMDDIGLTLATPRPETARGGSVMVHLPDRLPADQVVARLRSDGIVTDRRSQTLRLSPGIVTTAAGTERLIAALGRIVGPSAHRP
jgi:selenocysteine lyase/cysteine desulfurase